MPTLVPHGPISEVTYRHRYDRPAVDTLTSTPTTMQGMAVGGGMPLSRVIQSYGFKPGRGGRLGRSIPMAERTEFYEAPTHGPVTNITVSPNISPSFTNANAPVFENVSIGGGLPGGTAGGTSGGAPTGRTSAGAGAATGGGAKPQALSTAQNLLSKAENKAGLKTAAQSGDTITKSELKGQLAEGAGIRQTRNIIENKGLTLGDKATTFLNTQLEKVGARPLDTGSGAKAGTGGGGQIKVPAAVPQTGGSLEAFTRMMGSLTPATVTGSSPQQKVTAAAAITGNTAKLSQAEAKTALQSEVSANKILKQIQQGNITATNKTTAKLQAQAKIAKKK